MRKQNLAPVVENKAPLKLNGPSGMDFTLQLILEHCLKDDGTNFIISVD